METATENTQKSYFDVLNLCCSSEVALIERIVYSLRGVKDVSVIVPSKTVIVFHDPLLISASQIARALNQAKLEANIRVSGEVNHRKKWPSPLVIACGVLLTLSFLKYVYSPLQWLAVAAVAVGIWPVLKKGFAAVMNLTIDVNILVLTAVAGTLALRDYWESGTIVFLFTVSDWLQSRAYHRATAVMSSLMSIAPQKAILAETGEVIDVAKVNQDMILAVKAGEAIPVDGVVMEGSCEVDEKALTGEAFPVAKEMGSTVWAGTINLNGYITVRASTVAEEFAVAKMAKLVEEAQNKRPKIQRLIDECAKYYTPGVVLISAGLAVVPVVLGFSDLSGWFRLALVVLVSACPCGLILSTPVATFCALSKAATSGLLFKGGDYLEALANIKVVAFDKTGTITRGEFVVSGFESLRDDIATNKLLYWVSSIESKSSHPIAEALINYGRSSSIEPNQEIVKEFQNFTGEGISGRIDGKEIFVGNRKFALRAGCVTAPENRSNSADGRTLGFVYLDGAVIGTFNLFDAVRFGAADAIKDLKKMGITTVMLTGDSKAAAMHAQTELGCALDAVHFELLPEEKARIIEDYKNSQLPTAMVGDGINDAPALATADVGISMGVSGSALATETGHVILMSNDIKKIPDAIKLAKRTRRKVIENIVFTMGTKAVILVLALAGYPIVWLAVLADVLSCLLVILNSMTLLREEQGKSESLSSSKLDIQDKSNGEGCCRRSSASEQSINEAEKKNGSCCSGSVRQRRSSVVQDEKTLSLGSTCCSTSSNEAAAGKRCEPVKIESSSSTCNRTSNKMNCCSGKKSQEMSKESSAGVTTASKKCCGSVTCNEKDSPDIIANVDGNIGQGPCQRCLSSTSTISCQNKDCRDLEGQNGCLKGDDCGLNEGICSGREGKIVKADDSIIEVESSKTECSTSCCSVSGGAQVQLMVEEDPCCNTGKGGNREKDGSCRNGGEESSQVRDRHSAAQYGVQDHAFAENPPIQELTQPLLENTY